ncbi:MAG: hypothetical protein ACRDQZ_23675 [Mycobacteriales bacterium]
MPPIKHFLLLYDLHQERLLRCDEYASGDEAAAAYTDLETEYRGRAEDVQIVLVGADSIDTIKVTHSHYFGPNGDGDALVEQLRPAGSSRPVG